MKPLGSLRFLLFISVLSGCGSHEPEQESASQRLARWRHEARAAAPAAISNEVIGITRVLNVTIDDDAPSPARWTGRAKAEYVNPLGGISRTNISLLFFVGMAGVDNRSHAGASATAAGMY